MWLYKLLFFKWQPIFAVSYKMVNFFEHFDVPDSKFERIVFKFFKCLYLYSYTIKDKSP